MSDAAALMARRRVGAAPRGLWIATAAIAAISVLPIVALLGVALKPEAELWAHLAAYVLPYAARDTLLLVIGVGCVAGLIGVTLASLVSFTDFPGRKMVAAAAILPLAFPIYLHAFVYVELLDTAGPVTTFMRGLIDPGFRLPEIRSIGGAILIFSLVLYPYVYLPLTLAFRAQSVSYHDAARTLGSSAWGAFFRVQLPAARPAIAAGLSLALMEALADFGASEYLGVRTFAYTIYSTWMTRGSLAGAAQIALILIGIVALLIVVEAYSRRAASHQSKSSRVNSTSRAKLRGVRALAASLFCFAVIAVAFVIPAGFLVMSANALPDVASAFAGMAPTLITSALLAGAGASLIAAAALAIALLQRWEKGSAIWYAANVCSLGYAIPGVVLALGLLFASGAIDNGIDTFFRGWFGVSTGLIVGGTPIILLMAYMSRFMAVGHAPIHAHLQILPTHLDHVARTLGRSPAAVARDVLIPQLGATFAAAWLLLAVDIMKELPMTLLLRPIGIETLATSLYGQASRGEFEAGSLEALAILLGGVGAVAALQRLIRKGALRSL
jgi:iron(III) transport system permease protein